MPQPASVHVDSLLTDFAITYGQELAKDFVADNASTIVRVDKQSDKYPVWSKADIFRAAMQPRASGAPAAASGIGVDLSNSYFADVYALKTMIADRDRSNSKGELDLEKAKVRWLMGQAKLKRDLLWDAVAFETGLWTSNTEQQGVASGEGAVGAGDFRSFDDAESVPVDVIQTMALAVELSTGKRPNVIACNSRVDAALRRNPQVLDLYKHTQPGIPSTELVAQALGVDKIAIGRAVQNTAAEGASASMARVMGNDMLIAYIAPNPSLDEPTALAGFAWSEFDQVDANGAAIRSWYDQDRKGDWYEAEIAIDFKIVANDLGVYLDDAIL